MCMRKSKNRNKYCITLIGAHLFQEEIASAEHTARNHLRVGEKVHNNAADPLLEFLCSKNFARKGERERETEIKTVVHAKEETFDDVVESFFRKLLSSR